MASSSTSLLQLPFLRPSATDSSSRLPSPPLIGRRRSVLLLLSSPAASFLAGTLPSRAEDIPLFGLRKKIKKAEEAAEKVITEGEKAVEKEVEVVEKEIAAAAAGEGLGFYVAGDLVQAGAVVAAEAVGVLVGVSVVSGILGPEGKKL